MKKILLWCALLAFVLPINGCTVKNISNIKKETKKETKNSLKFNWTSKEQVKVTIDNAKEPIMVLFASPDDQQSLKAIEFAIKTKQEKKMTFLNMRKDWVISTFNQMNLREVPTLLILDPINEDGSKEMIGYSAIRTYLGGLQ